MSALNGSNLKFYTLPIVGYADINLNGSMQDVNDDRRQLHPAGREQGVQPAPGGEDAGQAQRADEEGGADPGRVDGHGGRLQRRVHGGPGRQRVPARWSRSATRRGRRRRVGAVATVETGTEVFYGAGASANAAKIATDFGATAKALASLPAEHVEVLLGTGSTVVPATLTPTSSSTPSPTPSSSSAGQQRRGRRRGHRRRQRQVRNTLRVLTVTVCSLQAGRNGDANGASRTGDSGQSRLRGRLPARGRGPRGVRLRAQGGRLRQRVQRRGLRPATHRRTPPRR